MLKLQWNFYEKFDEIFETSDIFEKFVNNSFMYSYLWNFWIKYSKNFESEIRTKFTENFENTLGKLWERFRKIQVKFGEKLIKLWFLSSKCQKNSLEISVEDIDKNFIKIY